MRIAISGTHSVGKSTLVSDFLNTHSLYTREEEPYRALRDSFDIKFGKDSTRYCNGIQLYYNISRVLSYLEGSSIIFDRSPVDYIAYSLYTAKYGQTDLDQAFVESLIEPTRSSLKNIDLLIFVPISETYPIALEDDGIRYTDESYRDEVDAIFKEIYREQLYNLLPEKNAPRVIEIEGPREMRIDTINRYL